ncbi:MAG: nuclear transport factor 2 family protein [Cyanophyceae cyanobacterium]
MNHPSPEPPPTAMGRDRRSLLAANEDFYRAFERKDLDAMGQIWSAGTDVLCIHPGRTALQGWDSIRSSWGTIFQNISYLEVEVEPISSQVNGCFGYVVTLETILQVNGRKRFKAQSIATNLFEHMGGRWYLIHHHGSPLLR